MKVRATRMGYYGVARIRPGEVFEIKDEKDLGKWMEKVNGGEGGEKHEGEGGEGETKEGESTEPDIDPETGLLRKPRRGKRF